MSTVCARFFRAKEAGKGASDSSTQDSADADLVLCICPKIAHAVSVVFERMSSHHPYRTIDVRRRRTDRQAIHDVAHLKLPTPDFDELESERFDLSKDSVECGLVREPAGEHRLAAILPG